MNEFMNIAIEEARIGIKKGHGGPFGSVIVKDNVVIAKGHNHVIKNNDPTCHGEVDAIKKACKKLKTFDLGDKVEELGKSTFNSCFSLDSLTIPVSIKKICAEAFNAAPLLASLDYIGTKSEWDLIEKEENWATDTLKEIRCSDGIISL